MTLRTRTDDESARTSSNYLPRGKALLRKTNPSSNLYKLLRGLSAEFNRFEELLSEIKREHNIFTTVEFIDEWESAVGIPDSCFTKGSDLRTRRLNVQAKIQANGTQTAEDLERIIESFGFEVRVRSGSFYSIFPINFPWQFFGSEREARNTLVIDLLNSDQANLFPVDFPWSFTGAASDELRCFVQELVPSTSEVVFRFGENLR